jgi:hypothetical protein
MMDRDDGRCTAIRCNKDATHTLTTKVLRGNDGRPDFIQEVRYCLDDALYFAAWLPYCYPGEYELISITPPASELFYRG